MGENSYDDEGIIDFFTSHTFKNLTVFDMCTFFNYSSENICRK
jgi:hypothetical protein